MKKTTLFLLSFILFLAFLISPVKAQENSFNCITYFTGVGCPHCAKADPIVLKKVLKENPDLVVIEYEIYQQPENAVFNYEASQNYDSSWGIPRVVFSKEIVIAGDRPIMNNFEPALESLTNNQCALINGQRIAFKDLILNSLRGKPKIWHKNKVLIKTGEGIDGAIAKKLLISPDFEDLLKENNLLEISPKIVHLSGGKREFDKAVELSGWIFQWEQDVNNVFAINETKDEDILPDNSKEKERLPLEERLEQEQTKLTLAKVLSLAAVDAVNPCALAVLILMLIAILTYNPRDKKKVLLAGLAFCFSVFVMYLFYGLVIIKFFQLIQALTVIRLWLYKILGGLAIILGLLNIRDFIKYKPGNIGTEMPLFLRPKVKKIISGVTSPKGAFVTGLFVTVFLLPCTVGPYVICGGILCTLGLLKALPWLLIYNIVFILPMIIITGLVYAGVAKVEDVSGWKDKNIKYLHLVAGIIIVFLGIAMLFGLVVLI